MQKQVAYYENLVDSFRDTSTLEPNSPYFDILRFEEIPLRMQDNTGNPFRLNAFVVGLVTNGDFKLSISNEVYEITGSQIYFTSPWHMLKLPSHNAKPLVHLLKYLQPSG